MRKLVRKGKSNLIIRNLTLSLIKNFRQKAWMDEIRAIHAFVRDRIRYVKDIRGIETLHDPIRILENRQGDCDDKAVIAASMLESIGHPTRFVAVGFLPGSLSHVYLETKLGKKWIPIETTEHVNVGWQPKGVIMRMMLHN